MQIELTVKICIGVEFFIPIHLDKSNGLTISKTHIYSYSGKLLINYPIDDIVFMYIEATTYEIKEEFEPFFCNGIPYPKF